MAYLSKIFGLSGRASRRAYEILTQRAVMLIGIELAGIGLVAYGISLWSLPSALIVGGLALIGAVEVRG